MHPYSIIAFWGAAVLRSNPFDSVGSPSADSSVGSRFILYVEGPSDCYILRTWAGLVSRSLARQLSRSAVILGGRRPARAVEHFLELRAHGEEAAGPLRGICVLDRDGHVEDVAAGEPEGLEFFTWPRRHIESYLLVPVAMRRCMRMAPQDPRVGELLGDLPRNGSEQALRALDAKRLLAGKSALARELGASLSPARIARCMNRSDLHGDVLALLDRLETVAADR